MVVREWLKAGILSYIDLAEGVNGCVRSYGSRAWMGRVGETEWRASRRMGVGGVD